ncbi:Nucleotidyl transferase [Candidatus Sulfotelmatomonas gaucii]|uniref:UTP--glucose-1-phosphate uridylyltransferase n=1 Tax=Candidatus Sulfuritelmatomonas gaucii TaxID=2043161 RepID=A0A2N9LUD1_9BACT|nr:Nucleotidyl transferase [Candidatus Sulfotelmatomonas gaucii]
MFDMQIRKAVITAAGKDQRNLPMQTLFDQQGKERSVLSLVVGEAVLAGIRDICIVVWPGDEEPYKRLLTNDGARLTFVEQRETRGYAHAVLCAQRFVKDEPFLHFVGDHIYVGTEQSGSAKRLVEAASTEGCAISAVQVTRESLLPFFGTVGGQPVAGRPGFYRVDTVVEKPTPTEAEQRLVVPGLRSGQYLCFYGIHVLTPAIFEILSTMLAEVPTGRVSLSTALGALAQREQYLAMIQTGQRFDVGVKYGLFVAQLALALNGDDRDEVLTQLIQVLATRQMLSAKGAKA